MPVNLIPFDEGNLVHGCRIEVRDRDVLAKYIALLLLGRHNHVRRIIHSEDYNERRISENEVNNIIIKLDQNTFTGAKDKIQKRDGWLFQMISWIAIHKELQTQNYKTQIPHDAPAQHGIDNLTVILNDTNRVQNVIVTEDKATDYPRNIIQSKVFPEFREFEQGLHDNKLIGRITGLLQLESDELEREIENDISNAELRKYRIGVTHKSSDNNSNLFKDYNIYVTGNTYDRRSAATFIHDDIRDWMEQFSQLVIEKLEDIRDV